MTLNSIYSLAFAVKKKSDGGLSKVLPEHAYSVFIKNEPTLRFLSCNTRKHHNNNDDVEIWTLLSSATFAKKYKGPQENLPQDAITEVTQLMLSGLETSLGLDTGSISVLESRLQLWGAAVPLNTYAGGSSSGHNAEPPLGYVYDSRYGVGTCGDWLLHPSIEGAWESGRRLASWISKEHKEDGGSSASSFSVGLPNRDGGHFHVSASALENGIGSFGSD